ncbi:MAG: hypothetical protein Tsb005_14250 [Gammaproteobacteria bacterium]
MKNSDTSPETNKSAISSFSRDFFRAVLLGSTAVTAVTPIANYNNHLIRTSNNQVKLSFTARRAFDGLAAYNTAVAPTIAISLIINRILCKIDQENNQATTSYKQLKYSMFSGFAAAIFGNFPEAIAQAQQLTTPKPHFYKIFKDAVKHNGFFVLGRGLLATMTKQITFNVGFMWMMPKLIEELESNGSNKITSLAIASILTGLFVGISTSPSNTLRWYKHHQINLQTDPPSYPNILKKSFNTSLYGVGLFSGWKPRAAMSTASMLILHEGKKIFDMN